MGTKELEILLCEISFVNTLFFNFFTSKKISEMFEKKNHNNALNMSVYKYYCF